MRKRILKSAGFTLIELLITISIILLMAVITIPEFSKYGQETSFQQKVSEIDELINQAQVSAQNPEQGIVSYHVYPVWSGGSAQQIYLDKENQSGISTTIKIIKLDNGMQVSDPTKATAPSRNYVLNCEVYKICTFSIASGSTAPIDPNKFFGIYDSNVNKKNVFSITFSPFDVVDATSDSTSSYY